MQLGSHIAVAVVETSSYSPSGPLAWEFPYAVGAALKKQTKNRVCTEELGVKRGRKKGTRQRKRWVRASRKNVNIDYEVNTAVNARVTWKDDEATHGQPDQVWRVLREFLRGEENSFSKAWMMEHCSAIQRMDCSPEMDLEIIVLSDVSQRKVMSPMGGLKKWHKWIYYETDSQT